MDSKGQVVVATIPPEYQLVRDNKVNKSNKPSAGPSKIYDCLYLGSWKSLADIENLKRLGITGVVNVSSNYKIMQEWAEANLKKHVDVDFCFVHLETDYCLPSSFETAFDTATRFIESHRPRGGKVLVQCNNGIERSASIAVAFVMRQEGLSYTQALAKLRNQGCLIHPNTWLEEICTDIGMPD